MGDFAYCRTLARPDVDLREQKEETCQMQDGGDVHLYVPFALKYRSWDTESITSSTSGKKSVEKIGDHRLCAFLQERIAFRYQKATPLVL